MFLSSISPGESKSISVYDLSILPLYTVNLHFINLENTGNGFEQDKTKQRLGTAASESKPGILLLFAIIHIFHLI